VALGDLQAGGHLVAVARERDQRAGALDHGGVAAVEGQRERVVEHLVPAEAADQLLARPLQAGPGPLTSRHPIPPRPAPRSLRSGRLSGYPGWRVTDPVGDHRPGGRR
jgi:hypothetical protein